jgi:hypothetical protein
MAQQAFVFYTVLIHINMFIFTLRLAFSLLAMTKRTRRAITKRVPEAPTVLFQKDCAENEENTHIRSSLERDSGLPSAKPTLHVRTRALERELTHAIIIPNYSEDLDTLRTTLTVLAIHPKAKWQYDVSGLS